MTGSGGGKDGLMRFSGKTVLVTGAASGMGHAAAQRFYAEGANLVLVDIDGDGLEKVAGEFDEDRVVSQQGDTADQALAHSAVAAAVDRFGGIDVLINNAGETTSGDITKTSEADFDRIMAVNVGGYYHLAKAAMPELVKTKGSIVMTSSVSGLGGDWNMFAYTTSKGAVVNMVRAMALDAAKDGVRVNAVAPSFTDTGMTQDSQKDGKLMDEFAERKPLGAITPPEYVASVMAFLASDDARWVTGVNLPVDGGVMASNGQPPQ